MPASAWTWLGVLALLSATLLAGCSSFNSGSDAALKSLDKEVGESNDSGSEQARSSSRKKESQRNQDRSKVSKVRLDGSLSLGDTDNLAFTTQQLASAFEELFESQQLASATTLIRLYPDLASRVMIENHSGSMTPENRTLLVNLYQQNWGLESPAYGKLTESYTSGSTSAVISKQKEFLELLETDKPNDALSLRLSRQAPANDLLQAESLRLEAMAFMMLEDYQQSIRRLETAAAILTSVQPIEANRIKLLIGETKRRNDSQDGWVTSWREAVIGQSRWIESKRLADPQFWKQAAFLRPISESWPDVVIKRMQSFADQHGLVFADSDPDESVVWATIGLNSLRRHESQNAILSFKKSESTVSDRLLKKELQMQQAVAMISGGQAGPASATLLRLSSGKGVLADRAKAILATLKLQNGSLAQGMRLLQSAIKTSSQWPNGERLRAQADYGLAYLMRGKEEQGVALLHKAYNEFIDLGDFEQASKCLFNIATYYEKTEQAASHKETIAQLERLEQGVY